MCRVGKDLLWNDYFVNRSRVMRKYNSVTYEVGKAKAEQASGMFGLTAE